MNLINKDVFIKLCKKYKLTHIDDTALSCLEAHLLEIIERETAHRVIVKDECNQPVKHKKKRKRRKSSTNTSKKVQNGPSKSEVD